MTEIVIRCHDQMLEVANQEHQIEVSGFALLKKEIQDLIIKKLEEIRGVTDE